MNGLAGRHRDVEGHDQDQAVGVAELGVLNAEAARFEVIGSMPQRAEYSSVRKYPGFSDIAMIQGSACPGS